MSNTQPAGMLQGLRILEVTDPLGALVSRFLADLGADVIKIEPPQGDQGRGASPFIGEGDESLSLPFVRANVNKRSVMLDLERRQDQERFRDLAEGADMVVSTEGISAGGARGIDLNGLATLIRVWCGYPSPPSALKAPTVATSATTSSPRPWAG